MNNDESLDNGTGNIGNAGNRNYSPQKYPEKMPNYSPSTSYNYGHHGGYSGMQQHPRRRADRFKRESLNLNDKVVRQNDVIIRLLKEIRDRLPPAAIAPAPAPAPEEISSSAPPASETDIPMQEGDNKDENSEQQQQSPAPAPGL